MRRMDDNQLLIVMVSSLQGGNAGKAMEAKKILEERNVFRRVNHEHTAKDTGNKGLPLLQ